jgi:hypothetical protein
VLSGTVTVDGFELAGSFIDSGSGCGATVALVANDDGSVVLTAGTGFEITCATATCQSIWVGALHRVTTTTTTVTSSTSTSTTLPTANFTGNWSFSGSLSEDSCGASGGLAETFTISQAGSALTSTVASLPGVVLSGTVTVDGFELQGSFVDSASGCSVTVALVASDDGSVVLTAGTGYDITCGLSTCRSIWLGTMRRI